MPHIRCFAPVADTTAEILILGSMPGKESLRAGQYYAHPRNAFWKIMGDLVGAYPDLPYEERLHILKSAGIALWDVLESCVRKTSLDSHIKEGAANNFKSFFQQHPNITHVFFNGAKAEQCFRKHVQLPPESSSLHYCRLPSTSPAHAGMSYANKLDAWRAILQCSSTRQLRAKKLRR
jgi:TDG/mug DNA glycosylase family protein